MRRKTFDVLFDTSAGMAVLTKQPCLWRSAFYFTLSVGFFTGVTTNCWLLEQELAVRFAIIIAVVIITATALTLYGFLLHGIMETFGTLAGALPGADAGGAACRQAGLGRSAAARRAAARGLPVDALPLGTRVGGSISY